MAWTLTTLKTAIQSYLETTETDFVSNLDNIIINAENDIVRAVQHPAFRFTSTLTKPFGSQTLDVSSISPLCIYSLFVLNDSSNSYDLVLQKPYDFVRSVFSGNSSSFGAKTRYFAWSQEDELFFADPRAAETEFVVSYWGFPASITDTSSTWLGDNEPDLLLYGCLVEGYRFLKGSADVMGMYEQRYKEALAAFKVQGEGYMTRDDSRDGQYRIPRQ